MFAVSPVSRLSIPTTECPRSRSASDRCDPMNPAAPVMTMRHDLADWRQLQSPLPVPATRGADTRGQLR